MGPVHQVVTSLASAAIALAAVKLSGGGLASGGGGTQTSPSQNKAVVRKLYREVWNQKDSGKAKTAAYEFISEDHILIDPSHPNPTPGVEAYMEMAESLRAAFNGQISLVVDDLVAQGLKVVAQISYKAEVGDKKARWTGTAVMEVEDGKILKSWVNSDSLSALIQLGLLQDVAGGQNTGSPGQFERVTKRAAGVKLNGRSDSIDDGDLDSAHIKSSDLKVVQALLGRSEAHPTKVLTGNEWLQYFDKVASDDESDGEGFNQRMRVDSKTGLDMII